MTQFTKSVPSSSEHHQDCKVVPACKQTIEKCSHQPRIEVVRPEYHMNEVGATKHKADCVNLIDLSPIRASLAVGLALLTPLESLTVQIFHPLIADVRGPGKIRNMTGVVSVGHLHVDVLDVLNFLNLVSKSAVNSASIYGSLYVYASKCKVNDC